MGRFIPPLAAAALGLALGSTATAGPPFDLVIGGCNEQLAGEVGIEALNGNVGQTIHVPVTVNTDTDVSAFVLEVAVPAGVVNYVGTAPGSLTPSFTLGGNWFAPQGFVRVSGFSTGAIPSGSVGTLAVISFEVIGAGSGTFALQNLQDGLGTYASCFDNHGSNPVTPDTWGRVKALYR